MRASSITRSFFHTFLKSTDKNGTLSHLTLELTSPLKKKYRPKNVSNSTHVLMVYMFETKNSTTNLSMGFELRSLNIFISCVFCLLLFILAYFMNGLLPDEENMRI